MIEIGALIFTQPWILGVLALLPAVAWLLRVTPPAPRTVRFPAVRLLFGLHTDRDETNLTPWWLLILRLLIAALIILGFAHPLVNPTTGFTERGPLILVVDDGWASAARWREREAAMADALDQAERRERPVMVITTAPPPGDIPVGVGEAGHGRLLAAGEARRLVKSLKPKPWPVDRAGAVETLKALSLNGTAYGLWLSDGLDDGHVEALASELQRFGRLDILVPGPAGRPVMLLPPKEDGEALVFSALRDEGGGAPLRIAWLRVMGDRGEVLARETLSFAAGEVRADISLALPSELRNRAARADLEGESSAAAAVLLDERWKRRPVGLVSGNPLKAGLPLLDDLFYLERALSPGSDVRTGSIGDLLKRGLSLLVLADVARLEGEEAQAVADWVAKGGVLVRFAGSRMGGRDETVEPDSLLPVLLRSGGRSLGGAMSWDEPQHLAPFPDGGPFAGLTAPEDVTVSTQILAEPAPDLAARTWARLADGTPLVTGERRGEGWVVLVHTTANTEWSTLPLSGLFVEMLRRLMELGRGVAGEGESPNLRPLRLMDGFGRLTTPPGTARSIAGGDFATAKAGPKNPPGFYGTETAMRALNLSPALAPLVPLEVPAGAFTKTYESLAGEVDLKPWFLAGALVLLLLDSVAALWLKGLLPLPKPATAAVLAVLFCIPQAMAAEGEAPEAALRVRLAYVETGEAATDQVTHLGLWTLTKILGRRSSAEMDQPMGLKIEKDTLLFFPLVYWVVTPNQPALSATAQAKVNAYMRRGGMILFDTRDGGQGAAAGALRTLLRSLDVPALVPVPGDHVLRRSFYLIDDLPGRLAGGEVWVAGESEINDGVSPVVIGGNDWAAAWAANDNTELPLFPAVPGGERQREMAYRFGVNLVMYALTGNYKTDQVHLPAIMERLTQ